MSRHKPEFSLDKPRAEFIKVDNEDLEEFILSFEDFFSLSGIPARLGKFSQLHIANDNEPVAKRNDDFYKVKWIDSREITYLFGTLSFDNVIAVKIQQKSVNVRITIFWRPEVFTPLFDQKGFLRLFLAWLNDFYNKPLPEWAKTELGMEGKGEPPVAKNSGSSNTVPMESSGQQALTTENGEEPQSLTDTEKRLSIENQSTAAAPELDQQEPGMQKSGRRKKDRRTRIKCAIVHWRSEQIVKSIDYVCDETKLVSRATYYNYQKDDLIYSEQKILDLGTDFQTLWSHFTKGTLESLIKSLLEKMLET